jgi:hypothetical protein
MIVDPAWLLSLMTELEPGATYKETYPTTAAAFARAAERNPLPGLDATRTATMLVAVAWFEGRFQVDAKGDCTKGNFSVPCKDSNGKPTPDAVPHSFCTMQINESNLRGYETTKAEILSDVDRCVTIGLRIMRESFRVCARMKLPWKLSWYASGGGVCSDKPDPVEKSRHRVELGERLAKKAPPIPAPAKPVDELGVLDGGVATP